METLERLKELCMSHLEDIERSAGAHGGFVCSQQIDDLKDLVCTVRTIGEIQTTLKKV